MLELIIPTQKSRPVELKDLWRVIVDSTRIKWRMLFLFEGRFPTASSISHCQITIADPLRFFVLGNSWHAFESRPMKLKKYFGWPRARTIINPLILDHGNVIIKNMEVCLSFPTDKPRKINRWEQITLRYWTFFGKRTKRLYLYRAILAQHECDHLDNITTEDLYKHIK